MNSVLATPSPTSSRRRAPSPSVALHQRSLRLRATSLAGAAVLLLAGCTSLPAPERPVAPLPTAWATTPPVATAASPSAQTADGAWWLAFDDPVLPEVLESAWRASPDREAARARVAQARAAAVAAGAAGLPRVDASGQILRQRAVPDTPAQSSLTLGVQASWELDLFGAVGAAAQAASSRLQASEAEAHAVRQAVAAEAATQWLSLRACRALAVQAQADADSRAASARLTALTASAGLGAPADAALARAAAAQAQASARAQATQCESAAQALQALTAWPAATLRERLTSVDVHAPLPAPRIASLNTLPAALLAQRPDLRAREAEVQAAAGDRSAAQAAQRPRVVLSGSLSGARMQGAGLDARGPVWSLGPLQVSLPLFDGGALSAQADASRAGYDAAVARYQAAVRQAVAEVEQALLALDSTAAREGDARVAVEGFAERLRAIEARVRGGLASGFELEDARQTALAAQGALTALQLERALAWVNLARALGGDWQPRDSAATAATTPVPGSAPRAVPSGS